MVGIKSNDPANSAVYVVLSGAGILFIYLSKLNMSIPPLKHADLSLLLHDFIMISFSRVNFKSS